MLPLHEPEFDNRALNKTDFTYQHHYNYPEIVRKINTETIN